MLVEVKYFLVVNTFRCILKLKYPKIYHIIQMVWSSNKGVKVLAVQHVFAVENKVQGHLLRGSKTRLLSNRRENICLSCTGSSVVLKVDVNSW